MLVLAYRAAAIAALVLFATACSGGNASSVTPHRLPTATPGAPSPSPAPSATVAGALVPATTVTSNLASATSYYATLPHQNLHADLQALAAHMMAGGAYTNVEVEAGGLYATLPDGTHAIVFADVPEEVLPAAAARSHAQRANRKRALAPIGPPTSHEYAFLVDDADAIFNQDENQAFASALTQAGFPGAGYGVDASSLSLENLDTLSSGYSIDLLALATHGIVVNQTNPQLAMQSSTTVTSASQAKYSAGLAAPGGGLMYSVCLTFTGQCGDLATIAFTPDYLVSKLHFTKGAYFFNSACYSHNVDIAPHVDALLSAAGVGIYHGWTKADGAVDADETEAFIMDRLFGEYYANSSGLSAYATIHAVHQRPFPLADIVGALSNETRSSPMQAPNPNENYATSDVGSPNNALADPTGSTVAYLDTVDYGNEHLTSTPSLANAFPSIASMHVAEGASGGTLSIDGKFPYTPGSVTITDSAGPHTLTPTNWTGSEVTVTVPNSGAGSSGLVQVQTTDDATAIASNAVPLTMWSGTMSYGESDHFTQVSGMTGSGDTNYTVGFNVSFRADVHPTVQTIDASPSPQNLAFGNVTGNSTAQVTAVGGTFTTDDPKNPEHATLTIANPVPQIVPADPVSANTFAFQGVSGQPSSCNDGMQGVQDGNATVMCPILNFIAAYAANCFDDANGDLCGGFVTAASYFGSPSTGVGGSIVLTMDPATYAISASTSQAQVTRQFAGSYATGTANVTANFGSPMSPPDTSVPAIHTRRTSGARAARRPT